MTDELAMNLYLKSGLPEKSYYKSLAGCMVRGYRNICLQIIKDKVNKGNIDLVLSEINDFTKPYKQENNTNNLFNEIMNLLNNVKNCK